MLRISRLSKNSQLILSFLICYVLSPNVWVKGLLCWNCSYQNETECKQEGMLVKCDSSHQTCGTAIHRRGNETFRVIKQCENLQACLTDQTQNWNGRGSAQCNTNQSESSVCKCCCFHDQCNIEESCPADLSSSCLAIPDMSDVASVNCSNSNFTGSVCNFRCFDDDHVLHPNFSSELQCLPNGRWNKPVPCCTAPRSCPPNLVLDLVVLMHVKDKATYEFTLPVTRIFLEQVKFGEKALRYALMYYSGEIHSPNLMFDDTEDMTNQQAWNYVESSFHYQKTDDNRVNTGEALRYVRENLFGSNKDRSDARNCLVIITDENSDDGVVEEAQALRESGVTIFNYFFQSGTNTKIDHQQLLEMSGNTTNIKIVPAEPRFNITGEVVIAEFFNSLCPVMCEDFDA